jgi:hypothetical protein
MFLRKVGIVMEISEMTSLYNFQCRPLTLNYKELHILAWQREHDVHINQSSFEAYVYNKMDAPYLKSRFVTAYVTRILKEKSRNLLPATRLQNVLHKKRISCCQLYITYCECMYMTPCNTSLVELYSGFHMAALYLQQGSESSYITPSYLSFGGSPLTGQKMDSEYNNELYEAYSFLRS